MPNPLTDPSAEQYRPLTQITGDGGHHAAQTIGGLPFTGADLAILFAIAVLLISVGVVMAHISKPRPWR